MKVWWRSYEGRRVEDRESKLGLKVLIVEVKNMEHDIVDQGETIY